MFYISVLTRFLDPCFNNSTVCLSIDWLNRKGKTCFYCKRVRTHLFTLMQDNTLIYSSGKQMERLQKMCVFEDLQEKDRCHFVRKSSGECLFTLQKHLSGPCKQYIHCLFIRMLENQCSNFATVLQGRSIHCFTTLNSIIPQRNRRVQIAPLGFPEIHPGSENSTPD